VEKNTLDKVKKFLQYKIMRKMFLIFFGIFLFLTSYLQAKEVIKIYSLRADVLNRPVIDCQALANYLNSRNTEYHFRCLYVKEDFFRHRILPPKGISYITSKGSIFLHEGKKEGQKGRFVIGH